MAKGQKHKSSFGLGTGLVFVLLGIFLGRDLGTLVVLGSLATVAFVYAGWHVSYVQKQRRDVGMWLGRGLFLTAAICVLCFFGGLLLWEYHNRVSTGTKVANQTATSVVSAAPTPVVLDAPNQTKGRTPSGEPGHSLATMRPPTQDEINAAQAEINSEEKLCKQKHPSWASMRVLRCVNQELEKEQRVFRARMILPKAATARTKPLVSMNNSHHMNFYGGAFKGPVEITNSDHFSFDDVRFEPIPVPAR
jgi:hypothetical protein